MGKAYIAGTDTLCGSVAEMSKCVRFLKNATGKIRCSILIKVMNEKSFLKVVQ